MLHEANNAGSPDWWLLQLGREMRAREGKLRGWRDYYKGEPPLPHGPKKAVKAYLDFQRKARTNFLAMVVDASVHRLTAIGVAGSDGRSDDEAWRWWQLNRMDARQKQLYRAALSQSVAYTLVGPKPGSPRQPLITVEHPREVITSNDPATGEVRAALKAWYDPADERGHATLYMPDFLYRWVTEPRSGRVALPWGESSWTVSGAPQVNPYQLVPVVPFECRPELGEEPEPEFAGVMEVQDRINLGMLNRMTAERYGAFRQGWVKGHKFREIRDPSTGQAILDPATGLPMVEQPFVPDPASLWASEGKDTEFGQFSQTDLLGYLKTHEADILDLLITSHTPAYYYISSLINIGADTVTALDGNHVSKVGEHHGVFGEGLETTLSIAARVAGVERDFSAAEIRWKDPRHLNPAVVADRATKMHSIGWPLPMIAEDMGESPQRVGMLRAEMAGQNLMQQQLLAAANAAAVGGAPVNPAAAVPPAGSGGAV